MWSRLFVTFVALLLSASAGQAAVLYSENFNGEGTAANAYDNGTTPEVNVGNIGVLQSTGTTQGGNATDTAWKMNRVAANGADGLRFGANSDNWATSANSAAILADGGFAISFDQKKISGSVSWTLVRVGSGPENGNHTTADLGALASFGGTMATYDGTDGTAFTGPGGTKPDYSIEYRYEFDSWAKGTVVSFTGLIDGQVVMTDTFTWNKDDDVKIVFGVHKVGGEMDNIVVSTIPEPA
tara:strand:+ start:511 stop:1230 length:720 start_codon:yes stop_codon:yes gene_type:complete